MPDPTSQVGGWKMLTSQEVATTAGVSSEDFQIWVEMMVGLIMLLEVVKVEIP